jgi:hypothetical protein
MLARKQKPPSLTERIRQAADKVRTLDAELKTVIDLYLDEQRASQSGADLPREIHRQILMGRYREPWYAILGLEAERAHE